MKRKNSRKRKKRQSRERRPMLSWLPEAMLPIVPIPQQLSNRFPQVLKVRRSEERLRHMDASLLAILMYLVVQAWLTERTVPDLHRLYMHILASVFQEIPRARDFAVPALIIHRRSPETWSVMPAMWHCISEMDRSCMPAPRGRVSRSARRHIVRFWRCAELYHKKILK